MTTHNQNTMILRMRDTIREIEAHDHENAPMGDLHCLNLNAWMGQHMVHVLRILDEAQAEIDGLIRGNDALANDAEKLIAEERAEADRIADAFAEEQRQHGLTSAAVWTAHQRVAELERALGIHGIPAGKVPTITIKDA